MLTTPVADAAETRANATYEAILWAFSRRGCPAGCRIRARPA